VAEAFAPPVAVNRLFAPRQETQGDLRAVAVERAADETTALVADLDGRARRGVAAVEHVAAINPEMAGACALRAFTRDGDSSCFHGC
jgi:hypothetical protein